MRLRGAHDEVDIAFEILERALPVEVFDDVLYCGAQSGFLEYTGG